MGIANLNPDEIVDDEFDDGAVLVIEKAFNQRGDRWYSYAAIKATGRWYITGVGNAERTGGKGMTTNEFVQWLTRGSRLMPAPRVYWAKRVYQL